MSESRFKVLLGIQNMELLRDGWSLGGVLFRKASNYDTAIQSVKRDHLSIITAIAELAVSVPASERIEGAVERAAQQVDAVLLPCRWLKGRLSNEQALVFRLRETRTSTTQPHSLC